MDRTGEFWTDTGGRTAGCWARAVAAHPRAAMHAIRSGAALAAVYIPENFARDMAAGRRPQISVFYNSQFMTPGNAASRALQDAVQSATAAGDR